jgi:hypothetical protein
VSYIVDLISENQFKLSVYNMTLAVTAMHEQSVYTEDELWEWCR